MQKAKTFFLNGEEYLVNMIDKAFEIIEDLVLYESE